MGNGTRCYVARKPKKKRGPRRYRFGFNQSGPYERIALISLTDGIGMMEFPVAQVWAPKTPAGPEQDPSYDKANGDVTERSG